MKLGSKMKPTVPQLEAGTYIALCIGVYAIGDQECNYSKQTTYKPQLVLTFEIPSKTVEVDGEQKPRQMSTTLNITPGKLGKLRQFLENWYGKEFDSDSEFREFEIETVLGRSAMLNVIQKENGYSEIKSIMAIPSGIPDPSTTSPLNFYDIEEWDDVKFENLPEWIQGRIKNSVQYRQKHAPETAVDFPDSQTATQTQPAPVHRTEAPF